MGRGMRECGRMISSTAEAKRVGPTDQFTLVNTLLEKSTEEGFTAGTTAANTTASGSRTR
jgi:hypothetical protein